METDKFLVTNIRQYLNSDNPKLGEDKLLQELSGFSCPKNWDILSDGFFYPHLL